MLNAMKDSLQRMEVLGKHDPSVSNGGVEDSVIAFLAFGADSRPPRTVFWRFRSSPWLHLTLDCCNQSRAAQWDFPLPLISTADSPSCRSPPMYCRKCQ